MRHTIKFNNKTNKEVGVNVKGLLPIFFTKKKYKEIEVQGRDNLIKEDGFLDIEIPVTFNILNHTNIYKICNRFICWINKIENNNLYILEDEGYFYKVKKILTNDIARDFKFLGSTDVTFICKPFKYSESGQFEQLIENNTILFNRGDEVAEPIIKLEGEGLINLNINGEMLKINLAQNITIDSEKKIATRYDNTILASSLKGDYPILLPGENTISWEGNVKKATIIVNERFY